MMELTKENVKVDDEYPYYISIWCGSEEGTAKTISQILNNHEKAREWDDLALDKEDKDIALHGAKLIKQNQKLRELSEKRVEELSRLSIEIKKDQLWSWYSVVGELNKLLKDSKK